MFHRYSLRLSLLLLHISHLSSITWAACTDHHPANASIPPSVLDALALSKNQLSHLVTGYLAASYKQKLPAVIQRMIRSFYYRDYFYLSIFRENLTKYNIEGGVWYQREITHQLLHLGYALQITAPASPLIEAMHRIADRLAELPTTEHTALDSAYEICQKQLQQLSKKVPNTSLYAHSTQGITLIIGAPTFVQKQPASKNWIYTWHHGKK